MDQDSRPAPQGTQAATARVAPESDTHSQRGAQAGGYEKPAAASQATSAGAGRQPAAHQAPVNVTKLTLDAHVALCFKWLDAVRQQAERDPQVGYVQSKASKDLLRDLIVACMNTCNEVTEEHVRMAWSAMWNEPTGTNGFSWKGKITVKAFCNNYGDYLARGRVALERKQSASTGASAAALVGRSGRRNMNIQPPVVR